MLFYLESDELIEQHIYVASTKIDVGGMERGTLYKCQTNMSMLTISYPFMSVVKCLDASAVKVRRLQRGKEGPASRLATASIYVGD